MVHKKPPQKAIDEIRMKVKDFRYYFYKSLRARGPGAEDLHYIDSS